MFRVDRSGNQIIKLDQRRFADLGLGERTHLQEWLAGTPDALGEELLVIQKEFAGFADTSERLDLLAMDKSGQLVVIENKLDDSGRDVVWQALKYAAYCSTLKQAQVLDIFQEHLKQHGEGGDAEKKICEFLDKGTLDEGVLNPDADPRIIFVAANFRKEVTATVLWLLDHRVRAQCFRVIPWETSDELFIDFRQIIPTPEVEEFMIRRKDKEDEKIRSDDAERRRHQRRRAFWKHILEALSKQGVSNFQNSPSISNSISGITGVSGCSYTLSFTQVEVRVDLRLRRDAEENKRLFDGLHAQRKQLESVFPGNLEWLEMPDKIESRIRVSRSFDDTWDAAVWPEIATWMADHVRLLDATFRQPLAELDRQLKNGGVR